MESMLLGKTEAWYLEGFVQDTQGLRHVLINTLPFRIGRRNDLSFTSPFRSAMTRGEDLAAIPAHMI